MRKTAYILFVLMLFALTAGAKVDPRKIYDESINRTKLAGSEATTTMTIIDKRGRKRVRKIAQVSKLYDKGKTEKKLIRFLAPAEVKGTGLLTFDYDEKDDDMWLFMPALRKTRRIVSSEKAKSFMGSEFSYADMSPPKAEDFTFKYIKDEKINGEDCWVIEMTAKTEDIADENGFKKRRSYIAKSDNVARKAEYYDLSGELQKILTISTVKLLDKKNKKYRATHLEMENIQNKRKSIIEVNKINYSEKISGKFFTTRYLEKN